MDKEYAVKVLYSFRSMVGSELADAIDISIALIKESMVQKPSTNSDYEAALSVWDEYWMSADCDTDSFERWCEKRLNSDKPNYA